MRSALDLDQRLDAWAGQAWWRHLAAITSIAVVAVVRWHHCVLLSQALIDEATYLAAFRAMAEGGSPYDVGSYHYTPFFAWTGATVLSLFENLGVPGELGTLGVLRFSSLAGLAITVWCSSAWLAVSWTRRLALAVVFVMLAPAAGAGLCTGNVSFAVIGVIVLALIHWPKHSPARGAVPAGLALGATVAAKPLAPLGLIALFFHRPRNSTGRRHQVAGLVGGLIAAALLMPTASRLGEMSGQPIHELSQTRSFSLHQLLALAGFEVSALAIVLGGAVAVAIFVRWLPLDRSQLLGVAVTASVLVTPIIWNHTLILTLPVQVMALAVAMERRRAVPPGASAKSWHELIFVALGALALQFSEGIGAVGELPRAIQIAFMSLPYFAPALLTAYVLVSTRALQSRRKR